MEIEGHFISNSKESSDFYLEKKLSRENFTEVFASQEKIKPNKKYLEACEKKYSFNVWDLWLTTAPRNKKRYNLDKGLVLGYIEDIIRKIEQIVETFKPEVYICYGPAGYTHLITYKVLMAHGVKIIETKQTSIPQRFMIMEDLSNQNKTLQENYFDILKNGLTSEEEERAKEFIINYQEKPKQPDCAKKFTEPLVKRLSRFSKKLSKAVKYGRYPPNFRYFFWPIIEKTYDSIGVFEKPVEGEKYVYFPLHFQPEASTLIYGKWYVDQLSLIENISKALPLSHVLYVKEHAHGYGNRSLAFYKRINRLPNVRLISPHSDNFSLIKNCSLILTVTGTSGWEGSLFQKPVITFGQVYYNDFKEIHQLKDISQLPSTILKLLDTKVEKKKVVEFVAAMFRSSYPGLARLPHNSNNRSMADENLKLLSEGIYSHLEHKIIKQKGSDV